MQTLSTHNFGSHPSCRPSLPHDCAETAAGPNRGAVRSSSLCARLAGRSAAHGLRVKPTRLYFLLLHFKVKVNVGGFTNWMSPQTPSPSDGVAQKETLSDQLKNMDDEICSIRSLSLDWIRGCAKKRPPWQQKSRCGPALLEDEPPACGAQTVD